MRCGTADRLDPGSTPRALRNLSPNGARPGRIVLGAPNDVNVHLTNLIADAGDVKLFRLEVLREEARDITNQDGDLKETFERKLMKVFDTLLDLGDDKNPGEEGIVLEEDKAIVAATQWVSSCRESGMEL